MSQYRNSSVYYAVFAPGANCYSYSMAFQMFCMVAGIECHYYPSQTMNHAWNIVYLGDMMFWVDVTWNDVKYQLPDGTVVEASVENGLSAAKVEKLRTSYLLIITEQLLEDHTL